MFIMKCEIIMKLNQTHENFTSLMTHERRLKVARGYLLAEPMCAFLNRVFTAKRQAISEIFRRQISKSLNDIKVEILWQSSSIYLCYKRFSKALF